MKYTEEQLKRNREANSINTISLKKDLKQITMQKEIDNHYPKPVKYIVFPSKLNLD